MLWSKRTHGTTCCSDIGRSFGNGGIYPNLAR